MSPFLEFITWPNVLLAYVMPLLLWGVPLLWRYLSRQPVTRYRVVYAGVDHRDRGARYIDRQCDWHGP